jgi:ferredoxin
LNILVTVDSRKCVGNQMCVQIAPGMFELGSAGYSRPTQANWEPSDMALLREAEENCPTGSIRVEIEE